MFAAVAAVVSAFHGGADLVANIKKKNRRRSSNADNDDEAERKKLQVSLETGESQIGFRYAADMNKFGDLVRVGDGQFACPKSVSKPHTDARSHRTRAHTSHCYCYPNGDYHESAAGRKVRKCSPRCRAPL